MSILVEVKITNNNAEMWTESVNFSDDEIKAMVETENLDIIEVKINEMGWDTEIVDAVREQIEDIM